MNTKIAYCGLACIVCSHKETCSGCHSEGCHGKDWCKNYNCCREKGFNGCWECDEFPCVGSNDGFTNMLDKPRVRTFAKFAKEYGEKELTKCLVRNEEKGIKYHYEGEHVGDCDKYQSEEEIINVIKFGKGN